MITEHVYNPFGDLFQTLLPEGNVIEYGYDGAGRLTSIERKPDAAPSSHGERTVYTLDGFGHRVLEEQQRWDGSGWVTEAATSYEYSTRCQLDRRSPVPAQPRRASPSMTATAKATDSLDVTYVYDDPLVPFSLGPLTSIARHGTSVDYEYDRSAASPETTGSPMRTTATATASRSAILVT